MKKISILKKSGSDWKRLATMSDDAINTSESPEISPEQFARSIVRRGLKPIPSKVQLTIRIDSDVLNWYRKQGRGYQTRISRLLRAYMEAHEKVVA
jgi:uncharacterized protein (DUF4415 family)